MYISTNSPLYTNRRGHKNRVLLRIKRFRVGAHLKSDLVNTTMQEELSPLLLPNFLQFISLLRGQFCISEQS